MTDLEISKALALAIGWKQTYVTRATDGEETVTICISPEDAPREQWELFDYRDWSIIGPIAEKLIVELIKCESKRVEYWQAIHGMEDDLDHYVADADTPQKAIALAVIGAKKCTP